MKIYKFNESVGIDGTIDDIGDILLDLKDIGIKYILTKCWVSPKTFNDGDDVYSHATKETKGYHVSYKIFFDKQIKIANADRQDLIEFFQELKNVEIRLKSFGKVRTQTMLYNNDDEYNEGDELTNTINIDILIITDEVSNLNQSNEEIINQCIGGYCNSHGLYVSFSTTSNHFWVSSNMKQSQFNKIAMQIYRDVEALCKGKIKISFDEIGKLGTRGNCIRMKIDK